MCKERVEGGQGTKVNWVVWIYSKRLVRDGSKAQVDGLVGGC